MTGRTFIAKLQKNSLMPPAYTCCLLLPLQKSAKHGSQGTSALEETRKEAEGINLANVAVRDKAILFPINMPAEKHLR